MQQMIKDNIYYVGVSDRRIKDFENYIPLTNGVSYNSYLIIDNKTCLLDTVDKVKIHDFLNNVKETLNGRMLDYLVIHHMEPDHCAGILDILNIYKDCKIVTNIQVVKMLNQFFGIDYSANTILVKEGDILDLGEHKLKFISAPMVHWPEVMVSYDLTSKILFSADAFGSFGALSGNLFYDEVKDDTYFSEARRYYSNIVGKYGNNVVNLYKKIKELDIALICPLHSYLWRKDFNLIFDKYLSWATYTPEEKAVIILYASMYGNTENAAIELANELAKLGVLNIKVYDISQTDETYLISEIFRCSHIALLSPTYNLGLYPKTKSLLDTMCNIGIRNRTFALIENGTWGPIANKLVKEELNKLVNVNIIDQNITIKSSLNDKNKEEIKELALKIKEDLN